MVDVIIIGLGCAGYTAAIYAARYKLSSFIVGLEEGGMGATAAEVGNWPGTKEIRGPDLMENFKNHALSFAELVTHRIARVTDVVRTPGGTFVVTFEGGDTVEGKAVIFATGSNKRKLGAPGEAEFAGKGVTYCATCDAFFYRNKTVAVLGGGDSAVEGAAIAAQVAKTVYLIHRRKEFRAEPHWIDEVKKKGNITLVLERSVVEILGDQKVRAVKLSAPFNGEAMLSVDGVFIEIGATPAVDLPRKLGCALDDLGYLKVDEAQRTSIPGVFGAGDVTSGSNHFAQFATAAGEAAVAANSAFNYLQGSR
jgi:thioredoxin reductase (NADPH)